MKLYWGTNYSCLGKSVLATVYANPEDSERGSSPDSSDGYVNNFQGSAFEYVLDNLVYCYSCLQDAPGTLKW